MRSLVQNFFILYFKTIARFIIWKQQPTIITITGSVGKTTTKDVLIAQLKVATSAGGTIRSQNSELSTPLSILGIEIKNKERSIFVWFKLAGLGLYKVFFYKVPRVLVLEVGAGGPGDITGVCSWLKSDIAVFTALSANPVHVDHFENREQLFNEKKQLALLSKKDAVVIYPEDDVFLTELLQNVQRKKITVSKSNIENITLNTVGTVINFNTNSSVQIKGVWSHVIAQSYQIGLVIADILELPQDKINKDFSEYYIPTPGRARLLQGLNQSIVIDDSYNASPIAVDALFDMSRDVSLGGRKIFLFGDMKELGEYSHDAHIKVGQQAVGAMDMILTIGEDSLISHNEAIDLGFSNEQAIHFESSTDAGKWLTENLIPGDLVLAKSSRHAIKMELALEQIVSPDQKQFLVQEYLS